MSGAAPAGGMPAGEVVDEADLAVVIARTAHRSMSRPRHRGETECSRAAPSRDSGSAGNIHPGGDGHVERFRLAPLELPGPTGESNRLSFAPRGVVLCLGPGAATARAQAATAMDAGNAVVVVAEGATVALASLAAEPGIAVVDGQVAPEALAAVDGIAAIACCADRDVLAAIREALARRPGPILPLITEPTAAERYVLERHVCVDTTAAGGNASLLAQTGA